MLNRMNNNNNDNNINISEGSLALTSETLPAARPWEVSRWKYTFGPGQTSQTYTLEYTENQRNALSDMLCTLHNVQKYHTAKP